MRENRGRELKRNARTAAKSQTRSLSRRGKHYKMDPGYARAIRSNIPEAQRTLAPAPSDFSMTTNRAKVLEYFETVDRLVKQGIPIILDMSPIQSADMPTICLLMSQMMDRRLESMDFGRLVIVRYPNELHPMGMLFKRIQFEETVMNKGSSDHNLFLSRTDTRVNLLAKKALVNQAEQFFGSNADVSSLNPILTEMMSNTQNHADPEKTEEEPNQIPWLAAVMPMDEEEKMCFCVVDLGSGIVENWRIRGIEQKRKRLIESRVIDAFFKDTQGGILRKNIPDGLESSTQLSYRGQGLKTILDTAQSGPFRKFSLFTNLAEVNLMDTGENIPDSKYNLRGTIYYWEMSVG